MSTKTEILSRTVGSVEFPTDPSLQTIENIGRVALAETLGILEVSTRQYSIHETSDVMANSNNGSSGGGSCSHSSDGSFFKI